jgi:pimeloyl-ACP methyl ester carboxylesterase
LLKKTDSVSNFPGIVALSGALAGTVTMQLDLDLIFPIRDVPSAELMTLKAVCLWNAGVIDARQRKLVDQRAQQFLETNIPQDASAACTRSHDSWGVCREAYYDPAKITVPALLVQAEWDRDLPPYMAQTLFPLLVSSPGKRYVMLPEGTHNHHGKEPPHAV